MSKEDAFKSINKLAGIDVEDKRKGKGKRRKYTIEDYAIAKKLPPEFLRELGLRNGRTGITIPYMDESGARISSRQRYGDTRGGPRFSWTKGSKVNLYGLWRLADIRKAGYVVLLEGESDSHTLWFHGYPALGIPGSSTFQKVWVDLLRGLKVYIFQEPDVAGEMFVRKISEALADCKFKDEVYRVSLLGTKDPSELHCAAPDSFKKNWQAAIDMAEVIDIKKAATSIEEVMPDAPVQLRQAPEWRFNDSGIHTLEDETGALYCVCRTPVLLSRRLRSLETGEEKVEICFKRDGEWRTIITERSTLFQSRTITQLSNLGMTITSENAKLVVRFLQALEAENMDLLEKADCVSQLGWHGKQFVPGVNGDLVIDVDPSTRSWLDAYHAEGTLHDWLEIVAPCRENSIFRFILAAAFAAPLLGILGHRIFIVHNWGETRGGKTAALKGALSVWGEPEGLMTSFYATRVGLERIAGFFRDLPLGIDERQVAQKSDMGDNLVYMLSLGQSKVRGAKTGGLQSMQQWRTIILTTGEEPLSSTTSHSGVYTRTLEIRGAPFKCEEAAQKFHELTSYGHAGPEFIRRIAKTLDRKDKYKELFNKILKPLSEKYKNKHLASHISAAALVALADCYVSKWFFDISEEEAFSEAVAMAGRIIETLEDAEELNLVEQAYDFLQSWILSNTGQFHSSANPPRYGFVVSGRYYVFPQIIRAALEDEGFSYRQVLRGLRERGLLETDSDRRRFTVTKRFEGAAAKFIRVIPDEDDYMGDDDDIPF